MPAGVLPSGASVRFAARNPAATGVEVSLGTGTRIARRFAGPVEMPRVVSGTTYTKVLRATTARSSRIEPILPLLDAPPSRSRADLLDAPEHEHLTPAFSDHAGALATRYSTTGIITVNARLGYSICHENWFYRWFVPSIKHFDPVLPPRTAGSRHRRTGVRYTCGENVLLLVKARWVRGSFRDGGRVISPHGRYRGFHWTRACRAPGAGGRERNTSLGRRLEKHGAHGELD